MNSRPDLSIIIVSFNTKDLLKQCIDSVYANSQGICYEIIVVDNHSADDSLQMLNENFKDIQVIENKCNVGFARANNQGIRLSNGRYILLLNSDTMVLNSAIEKLVGFLNSHKEAGVVGPMVLNEDRTLQFSFGDFPSLLSEIARSFRLERRLIRRKILKDRRLGESVPFQVDWVSGSCFMIRREVYEEIGGLDETFFLFGEEPDWCLRARKAGWGIFYNPEPQIIHYSGQSTKKDYYLFIASRYESRLRLIDKHFSWLKRIVFRIIVVPALFARILIGSFMSFSNKAEKEGRRQAYRQSLLFYLGFKRRIT